MEHALPWPGGEVPDGPHFGDGLLSVPECLRLGPQAQYIPLPGPGVPPWRNPEGASTLPWYAHSAPAPPPQEAVPRGHYVRFPLTSGAQETGARRCAQLLDIGGGLAGH